MKQLTVYSFMKGIRVAGFVFTACLVMLASVSCSKKQETRDELSFEKSSLLLDIFSCMKAGEYKVALNKLSRLKSCDETNLNITELEHEVKINYCTSRVNRLLDKGKYQEGLKFVEQQITLHGEIPELLILRQKCRAVTGLYLHLQKVKKAANAAELQDSAEALERYVMSRDDLKPFDRYAKKKIEESKFLAKVEYDRTLFNLYSEVYDLYQDSRDSDGAVLAAILEIETDLKNPYVSRLKKMETCFKLPSVTHSH